MIKAKLKSVTRDKMMLVKFKHRNILKAHNALEHICKKRRMKITHVKY